MRNKRRWILAAPAAFATMAALAWAGPDWPEIGDAGSFPGVGQLTFGGGPIESINGGLAAPLGAGLPEDFEDLYLIRFPDQAAVDAFSATATFTGGSGGAQLVLFDGDEHARLAATAQCELSGPAGDPPFTPPEPFCDLICDPGDIPELEPCAEFTNEGCIGGGTEPIELGQTICGTIFVFAGFDDTDWYEFTVTDPCVQVTATLESEFQGTVSIVPFPECGSALGQIGASNHCVHLQDAVAVVGPGTYAIGVSQNEFFSDPIVCGEYRVTLTAAPVAQTAQIMEQNPADPLDPGVYYLGVTGFDNRPFSDGGVMVDFGNPFDLTGDGFVTFADLVELILNFGACDGTPPCPPEFCPPGDFDLDCDIDSEDLQQVLANYGLGPGDDFPPEAWEDLVDGAPDVGEYTIMLTGAEFALADDCPADINLDRMVSVDDLSLVINSWSQTGALAADINNDGVVNTADLVEVILGWGDCPPDICPGVGDCFVPHASPGCDDTGCCDEVCAVDVFCCRTTWDDACVAAAELRCVAGACCFPDGSCQENLLLAECAAESGQFAGPGTPCTDPPPPPPPLEDPRCPVCQVVCRFPGDLVEAEACGEDLNGGCDPPALDPIACGQIACGRVWADGGDRDMDWYQFSVTDACNEVRAQLVSEFPGVVAIMDGVDGCAPVMVGDFGCAVDCANNQLAIAQVPPGDYLLVVTAGNCDFSEVLEGYPCDPSEDPPDGRNEYRVLLACSDCIVQGACCLDDGCEVLTEAACIDDEGDYLGDFTTCDPDPCPAP